MKPRSAPLLPARLAASVASAACLLWPGLVPAAHAQATYYICPGNIFTNTLSAREAELKGCKSRDAKPVTIAAPPAGARPSHGTAAAGGNPDERGANVRVRREEQRARDTDARRILEEELRKEEAALDALRREYNNGEPERRGDERNAQKYLDRVAEMKAAITRKEADVAAIRRELAKLSS